MGLGSTAKKVQIVAERAEQVYVQLNEVREQMNGLRETVEHTGERVEYLARENAAQRALLEAIAEEQGIDVDAVLAKATTEGVDVSGDESAAGDGDGAVTTGDGGPTESDATVD